MKGLICKIIPSIFTGLNLYFGLIALVAINSRDYKGTAIAVCIGIFFDFFDGFFARLLKTSSLFGKEFDSLADVVTSGVVPGMVMYAMFLEIEPSYLIFFAGLIPVFAAVRLANFNIDTRQSTHFVGLNTPTNTLLIISLPFVKEAFPMLLNTPWELFGICIISSFLMNTPVYLFSLKIKEKNLKSNWHILAQLLFSITALYTLKESSIPLIILFYIGLSLIIQKRLKVESNPQ